MKKTGLIVLAAAAVVIAGCGGGSVPSTVAVVNGEAISGKEYVDTMVRFYGKSTLQNLIDQKLTLQIAKEENVLPTDKQIQVQIDRLKDQGAYDDQVKLYGEEFIKSQLYAQQANMNLAKKYLKPTDEELKQTYEMAKTLFVHGPRQQISALINTDKAKLAEAKKKAVSGTSFDDLSGDYQSPMFGTTPFKFSSENGEIQTPLSDDAKKVIKGLKKGDVSDPVNIAPEGQQPQYAIFTVTKDIPAISKKLADVKDEVADIAAMQKAQYDQSYREKIEKKKADAKIDIKLPDFKDVADQFTKKDK
ncbi:MAG: peptidyl-prolyl cis-trans isomerase [Abditibacteriota bacterium]|nr:peptidyl-prolyl cis-trans isomerase [Abditibacteriota bacterium]